MAAVVASKQSRQWWKSAIVYQIWPNSFAASAGNKYGDFRGALSKLDHLVRLGVDVVWFSPVYASPCEDEGYDISDYYNVNPRYGTKDDFDALLQGCKERGLKLVMDLVVNHCSDQAEYFKDSAARRNGRDDWFIWRDGKVGENGERKPPNNWLAAFGGSAWKFHEGRGQYYLCVFSPYQPDFNWELPEVRDEVHRIMRYWMDKGVAGFRMDVINMISKTPGLPDAPITRPGQELQFFDQLVFNGPRLKEYLDGIYAVYRDYPDSFNVGEMPATTAELALTYVQSGKPLEMVFSFEHVDVDLGPGGKFTHRDWKLSQLKEILGRWQRTMQDRDGWNSNYLWNHDQPSPFSRYGDDSAEWREVSTRMVAMWHISLSGTVYVYQGQELGVVNRRAWTLETLRDLESINAYHGIRTQRAEAQGVPEEEVDMRDVLVEIQKKSRDNARRPVSWTADKYAGFSTVQPWIDNDDDYKTVNAAAQVGVPGSVYEWYRALLALRKQHDTLCFGRYVDLLPDNETVWAHVRKDENAEWLILLNFSSKSATFALPKSDPNGELTRDYTTLESLDANTIVSNYDEPAPIAATEAGKLTLRPWEGRYIRLE
ncbi:hypothetical protein PYCC9005_004152 [Savitreella phatthalungensis]